MPECLVQLNGYNQCDVMCCLGNSVGADVLTEHPLLSEPSPVSFYNWMSNAVGNRTGGNNQESPLNRSQHNSLQTGGVCVCVLFVRSLVTHK